MENEAFKEGEEEKRKIQGQFVKQPAICTPKNAFQFQDFSELFLSHLNICFNIVHIHWNPTDAS